MKTQDVKNSELTKFEKEHSRIVKRVQIPTIHTPQYQWQNQGDFFIKFSLYSETSSGQTSSGTAFINQV